MYRTRLRSSGNIIFHRIGGKFSFRYHTVKHLQLHCTVPELVLLHKILVDLLTLQLLHCAIHHLKKVELWQRYVW